MNIKSKSAFFVAIFLASAGVVPTLASARSETPSAMPEFLGGLPVAAILPMPDAMQPAYKSAFDLEAVERYLRPKQDAPKLDPMETAAITSGVFRSVAIPIKSFPVSNRWAPIYKAIKGCVGNACGGSSGDFSRIVANARQGGFIEKLNVVNRSVNKLIAYKRDSVIHGKLDYWAKPAEILKRRAGDCEDFAILKMAALADAGVPMQSMSLVVLQDQERSVFHAILSVTTSSGIFILDNVRDTVLKDRSLRSYVPLYSFSTDRAWIHGSSRGSGGQVASVEGRLGDVAPGEGPQETALKQVRRGGWMPQLTK